MLNISVKHQNAAEEEREEEEGEGETPWTCTGRDDRGSEVSGNVETYRNFTGSSRATVANGRTVHTTG